MYLHSLTIENFRSIRSAKLDFDDTTLIIGENDSGKSSLLEALAKALAVPEEGAPRFESHHFYRGETGPSSPPAGTIRIALVFQERHPGEWDRFDLGELAALLKRDITRPRQLQLRITAPPPDGEDFVTGHWEIVSPGARRLGSHDDPGCLAALRALNHFVWLRSGSLLGPRTLPEGGVDTPPVHYAKDIEPLVKEIEDSYQAIVSGTTRHLQSELKAGYEAARTLLAREEVEFHSAGALSRSIVEEILDLRAPGAGNRALAFHGSAAQQIGVLILTAAILRQLPGRSVPGAESTLVLEDPEAHLHLMTLASVWGLIDQIKSQKIICTQSGNVLATAPLHGIRRITRHAGEIRQWRVRKGVLDAEELRKLSYHVRVRRDDAVFARCWLLVEGETEFWILPELARLCGYDLPLDGVACVEFAQCGLTPLIKMANELGIEWHVLTDGDQAGRIYAGKAREFLDGEPARRRLTALRQRDIEHCFWKYGYEEVFLRIAGLSQKPRDRVQPRSVINRAIKRHSKPGMAFELIVAAAAENSPGVPAPLQRMLDTCVGLSRRGRI